MTDWILRGGEVVDGPAGRAGAATSPFAATASLLSGFVARAEGAREIDVTGKIGAQALSKCTPMTTARYSQTPAMAAKASQGVTAVVTGNCEVSLAPLALDGAPPPPLDLIGDTSDYRYERSPASRSPRPNAGGAQRSLPRRPFDPAGRGDERARPAGRESRAGANGRAAAGGARRRCGWPVEWARLRAGVICARRRDRGVGGVASTGRSALYRALRNEANAVIAGLEESFAAGRACGCAGSNLASQDGWPREFGRTVEALPLLAAAIARQEIGLDAYPYIASSTD